MPSRPLAADTKAVVSLLTKMDNEAIGLDRGRTDLPSAVARLAQLVPPARVDLIDQVLVAVGRRDISGRLDWPPIHLVHQLAYQVKRVHLGEVRMRGPNGEVVDVIQYKDKLGFDRRCYRLTRHGVFIGEYKTPEDLGQVVDLAELVEEEGPHHQV